MFTQQDLLSIKKFRNKLVVKHQHQQSQSSIFQDKSEQQLYFNRYFLNNSFKILHIEIVDTQQVALSLARFDSYMIYVIKVLTEDFSYDVRRRYSQFYKLYQKIISFQNYRGRAQRPEKISKINFQNKNFTNYCFPIKKISSSLRNFFNITTKQKLAHERKFELCTFLNQIKNNYGKLACEFTDDYTQLLKFLNMKQQHQNFWRRKEGRCLQLSNLALKNTNLLNQRQGEGNNQTINIEYLAQLLQHQINKLNLAVVVKSSFMSSSASSKQTFDYQCQKNDPMVTDQIIKNVDCIKQIVLQLKRKINYDHIRCILKGKDIKQGGSTLSSNVKKGLIQYSLKYAKNQLVSVHILKVILNVFLNSEFNYSSDAFMKVLSELQMSVFCITQEKQQSLLLNKQFREIYFRIVRQYISSKQQFGNDKKFKGIQSFPFNKIMSTNLGDIYQKWNSNYEKNKQFRLKDEQKQWTMIIENFPEYNPKKSCYLDYQQNQNINLIDLQSQINRGKNNYGSIVKVQSIKELKQNMEKLRLKQIKNFSNEQIKLVLRTETNQCCSYYLLQAQVRNKSFKNCQEIIKNQKSWNPLLLSTQPDIYSNTRKDFMRIPGKQQKMFRFTQQEQIQMDICEYQLEGKYEDEQNLNYVHLNHQQQSGWQLCSSDASNPKMSTQTMPSSNGSNAYRHQPQEEVYNKKVEQLAQSEYSQNITLLKSPPIEGFSNSYFQRIKISRVGKSYNQICLIQLEIIFTQPHVRKYFMPQIEGSTQFIWSGFKEAFTSPKLIVD